MHPQNRISFYFDCRFISAWRQYRKIHSGFCYSEKSEEAVTGGSIMNIRLDQMTTEKRNPKSMDLHTMTPLEIVTLMNEEDAHVHEAVHSQLEKIAAVVELGIHALRSGGRIFYTGAGTSGRLGVLDAAECPPTFGVTPDTVIGLIAGGERAFTKAVEGAEDSKELGRSEEEELERQKYRAGLIPAGRVGHVRDIANAAVFLGSDESSYINGVELLVDGGLAAVYPVKL